ncbi:MAG TPA: response regulator [Epsilonproteobacteria bacterium]|nr:response regulator [Campylobacterota bacterium]
MDTLNKLKNIKLLYIDDEAFIRMSAVEYLSYYCDHVYAAGDGIHGYELYKELQPDIIITDIKMPKLNGLDLVEKIRKKDPHTQIIIITAYTDTTFLLKAVELKLVKYLVKPVSEAKLIPLLKDAINYIDSEESNILELREGFRYDKLNKTLFQHDTFIKLNNKEALFFDICAKNHHRVVTYSELENFVWEGEMSAYALSSLVKSLRSKLPKETLQNISGTGYKIVI